MRQSWLAIGFIVGLLLVGSVVALSDGESVSGDVPLSATNGPNVTVSAASELELTDAFPGPNRVNVSATAGNATFESVGTTKVTVAASEMEGPWTNVTGLDVAGTALTVDPADKPEFIVEGSVNQVNVSATVAVADGSPDFVVAGSGPGNVSVDTATTGATVLAVNESGAVLDSTTPDATGRVTFDSLSLSQHTVSLKLSGVGPGVSNLQPSGFQTSNPTQASVDIAYNKFPQGNSVEVEFVLDGTTLSTQTISSNQTVTASMPSRGQTAGAHKLNVSAEDTSTSDTTTANTTYQLPDEIFIRNETSPNQNVTANVTVTSFGEQRVTRNFSGTNGVLDVSGLPADRPLLIRMENQSFYNRTVFLDNLFTQQRVYILNKTITSNTVRFVVDDRTGEFADESTEILLDRVLDVNGSVQYERVSGDLAAVDGHTAIIKDGERYRIIVRNDAGDTRILGGYDSLTDETVTLEIGQLEIEPQGGQSYIGNATYNNSTSPAKVLYQYSDPSQQTDAIKLRIFELGNESNVVLDQSYAGPFGQLRVTEQVPSNVDAWVVEYEVERNGTVDSGRFVVGPKVPVSVALSQHWQSFIGVISLVVVAGLFGGVRAELGAIAIPLVAGLFWFIGWLPAAVGAGAILLALVVSVLYYTASPRGAPTR